MYERGMLDCVRIHRGRESLLYERSDIVIRELERKEIRPCVEPRHDDSRSEANRAIARFVASVGVPIQKVPQSRLITLVLYPRAGSCIMNARHHSPH